MADFPYTQSTAKIKYFLDKVQSMGKPDVVNKKWLDTIGLQTRNDTTLVPVFKFIGFLTPGGQPTERWSVYKGRAQAKEVLAEGIREGYKELFQHYPDAEKRSIEELKNFFSARSDHGKSVTEKTVTTFKNLCALADFSKPIEVIVSRNGHEAPALELQSQDVPDTARTLVRGLGDGVAININIQLTVPETTNSDIYEAFFKALKNNLFPERS